MLFDSQKGLGDHVEILLSAVGVTKERVERYLGSCKCDNRQAKLNRIGAVASRFLQNLFSSKEEAKKSLETLIDPNSQAR